MFFEDGEDGFPGGSEGFFFRRFFLWHFPSEFLRESVEGVEGKYLHSFSEEYSKIGFSKGLFKFRWSKLLQVFIVSNIVLLEGGEDGFSGGSEGCSLKC